MLSYFMSISSLIINFSEIFSSLLGFRRTKIYLADVISGIRVQFSVILWNVFFLKCLERKFRMIDNNLGTLLAEMHHDKLTL